MDHAKTRGFWLAFIACLPIMPIGWAYLWATGQVWDEEAEERLSTKR